MLQNELYTVVEIGGNTATIRLLAESAIYQAHFPGNPITPGMCQVGIVGELLETMRGRRLELREVKNLKFMEVLKPGFVSDVVITFDKMEEDDARLAVKGTFVSESRTYTKFSLVFEMI